MGPRSQVHTKVTRDDWIKAAQAALEAAPIDQLRILTLASDLGVSRSSFYWYFTKPEELHDELLAIWERNTDSIVERATHQNATIVAACLDVFECWADHRLYDANLDLAVRDWGRRDKKTAVRVANADRRREDAFTTMFLNHGFAEAEALVRARLVYHSQVGYYAVGTNESIATRLSYLPYYLEAMTGAKPSQDEITNFEAVLAHIPPR